MNLTGSVVSVARDSKHRFSKLIESEIRLIEGLGVDGDSHAGKTVQHRSRVIKDPSQPNLRQVHIIHTELFQELAGKGFSVAPADLGENIATKGLNLLSLPRGACLKISDEVVLEITGLRNPCSQIEQFQTGLLAAVLTKEANGALIRKSGVMSVVLKGGVVRPDDIINVQLPSPPYRPLERV